jgi:ribosomal protein S18 acetylase RimI-like enzyme
VALILGGGGPPADQARVAEFLEFAAQRGIDLSLLWVARAGERIVWAALPVLSPGKTMLVLHPGCQPAGIDVGPVIRSVCDLAASRGVQLAQALVDPTDAATLAFFTCEGFATMAELLYLHRLVRKPLPTPPLPGGFALATYSSQNHSLFARTILRSYQGSLDCPGLNGLRDVEDIVAGHKTSGEFDPQYWFLLSEGQTPQAVLLLSKVPRTEGVELVYLGLAPEARGRGVGDVLVRQALWAVRQMNLSLLSLAVDAQNAPALRLYHRHGFVQVGSKLAMMRDLRQPRDGALAHSTLTPHVR